MYKKEAKVTNWQNIKIKITEILKIQINEIILDTNKFQICMDLNKLSSSIYTINNFWSEQECLDFISKSESIGYEPATVDTENGQIIVEHVRNNERIIYTDNILASTLWQKLNSLVPSKIGNCYAIGLNELFRFYKYKSGQEFKRHRDQSYIRNDMEASYFTFMIYLNENYLGGETTFADISIQPKQGMALIFLHDLEHSGNPVKDGTKYVLRTDIMYRLQVE
ncbi:MAG: 2OG-Fe(II) oxygenase [Chitinophagales bacterium]